MGTKEVNFEITYKYQILNSDGVEIDTFTWDSHKEAQLEFLKRVNQLKLKGCKLNFERQGEWVFLMSQPKLHA